jgi:Zn-dependent protease
MPTDIVGRLIIYIVVLLLAISAHEAAHAWMSHKFGDDTAYLLGRVTLNPVKHTDPIGTLLIPIISFISASAGVGFVPLIGWGKPTPVNPLRWRNKNVANLMVSLAGIMANTLIAIIALVVIKALQVAGVFARGSFGSFDEPVRLLLVQALMLNASLAVFNLLPVPPLDGSKVLYTFLPASAQPVLEVLERFSFLILIGAIYFGVFDVLFAPVAAVIVFIIRL